MSDDVVERSNELDRQILAIPADRVYTKRMIGIGFIVLVGLLAAILVGIIGIQLDTKDAVERQVIPLQNRVAELEETVADQESIITQQTDAIVLLLGELQAAGLDPPEIVIRPPEDET